MSTSTAGRPLAPVPGRDIELRVHRELRRCTLTVRSVPLGVPASSSKTVCERAHVVMAMMVVIVVVIVISLLVLTSSVMTSRGLRMGIGRSSRFGVDCPTEAGRCILCRGLVRRMGSISRLRHGKTNRRSTGSPAHILDRRELSWKLSRRHINHVGCGRREMIGLWVGVLRPRRYRLCLRGL